MPGSRITSFAFSRRNKKLVALCYALIFSFVFVSASPIDGAQLALASQPIPLHPYAYATSNSTNGYDIMVGDGVNADRRVARVKVDGVAFTDVSARLSADATLVAFRVTGDRLGGSSLYSVSVVTGKYGQVALSKTNSEGIGAYAWSPAGNTLAFVRSSPALDPALMDGAYGTIYVYSVGFQAAPLKASTGNDRLLGFSGEGLGVYVARRQTNQEGAPEDLAYLPLSSDKVSILIKNQPNLRYSHYTYWPSPALTPKVAFIAEGDFSLAAGNSNAQQVSPNITTTVHIDSKAPGSGRLVSPYGLGLVTSDMFGLNQSLLRRDAENYTSLSWTPDGSGLLVGSTHGSWRVALDGNRVALGTSVADLRAATGALKGTLVVMGDQPTTRLVTLDYSTGKVTATRYVGVTPKPSAAALHLQVPYIHQVNDTADNADGNWACGPTSVAMALAYYGKLDPWYMNRSEKLLSPAQPTSTPRPLSGADYALYITSEYTYNGHTYSATAPDPKGNELAGLYGTICPMGLASWPIMAQVISWHGLNSQYVSATWDGIVSALKRGHPVLLGNRLTSEGHILVVVGYTNDGNLVVNDPYGNRFAPGYGSNDGNGILYPWKRVTPRNALEVIGVYPPPAPTATPRPTATTTSTPTP